MSPYPRRKEQQEESRLLGILIFASSKAKPRAPLKCRALAGCGVAQVFLANSSSAWLLCALHRAGPGGCKFSMRLRSGGFRICLRALWEMSVRPTAPVPSCWLISPALAFAGRWFCSAAGRAGWHSVSSTARLFSSHSSSMAHCCFSPSQRLHALLRRGHTCRWAAEPHSWPPSALTCTSKKDGVQMASLVPEITAGHHLASTLVEKLPFGLPFSWYCFGCLCLKGTFKTNTPYAIFPTPVLPLS